MRHDATVEQLAETRARWKQFKRRAALFETAVFAGFLLLFSVALPDTTRLDSWPVAAVTAASAVAVVAALMLVVKRKQDRPGLSFAAFDVNALGLRVFTELRGGTLTVDQDTVSFAAKMRDTTASDLTSNRFVVVADSFGRCYVDVYSTNGVVAALFVAAKPQKVADALTGGVLHAAKL